MQWNFFIDPVVFLAGKTGIEQKYIRHLIHLTEEGATIPFIARYRKEMTGNMDEVKIAEIREMYVRFQELEKKKGSVMETIRQQGKLTDRLEQQIRECQDLQTLEDIYLPFKPKRQTRAAKAKEKGLEPLAAILMKQENGDVEGRATRLSEVKLRMKLKLCREQGTSLQSGSMRARPLATVPAGKWKERLLCGRKW